MDFKLYLIFSTYLITLVVGIKSLKAMPLIGRLAFAWVALSCVSDIIVSYLSRHGTNNILFFNIYDYLALPVEFAIGWYTGIFRKGMKVASLLILTAFMVWHVWYNVQNGMTILYPYLSYLVSIFHCFYFGTLIITVLTKTEIDFETHKLSLLLFGGVFIFEAAYVVPILHFNLPLNDSDRIQLASLCTHTVLIASIIKNAAFALYFFLHSHSRMALRTS